MEQLSPAHIMLDVMRPLYTDVLLQDVRFWLGTLTTWGVISSSSELIHASSIIIEWINGAGNERSKQNEPARAPTCSALLNCPPLLAEPQPKTSNVALYWGGASAQKNVRK